MSGESIHVLLPKVMAEIGAIGKDQQNQHQRYNFRGIDDALNAVGPALRKHGVSVSVETELLKHEQSETSRGKATHVAMVRLALTFHAPDGTSLTSTTIGEGFDSSDKATNKAMSAAMKYALFFGLMIPVSADSLDDSDRESPEPPARRNPTSAKYGENGERLRQEIRDAGGTDLAAANALVKAWSQGLYESANRVCADETEALFVLESLEEQRREREVESAGAEGGQLFQDGEATAGGPYNKE